MISSASIRPYCLILALLLSPCIVAQTLPPEMAELSASWSIQDLKARLKEQERIMLAYPHSAMKPQIEANILGTKQLLAANLGDIQGIFREIQSKFKGAQQLQIQPEFAKNIMQHPKLKSFPPDQVVTAILYYQGEATKLAAEPDTFIGVPEVEQKALKGIPATAFGMHLAQAHLNAKHPAKAMAALEAHRQAGGALSPAFSFSVGEACFALGRFQEALNGYLEASLSAFPDALAKAKITYSKLNGKLDGFETLFESEARRLPFRPDPYKASPDWKGRAVLAELFTGSECPPCVGADLAFDGLLESFPSTHLVVLEYHLPIPSPDPIMNPTSKLRQAYYGIRQTPTTIFNGGKHLFLGGSRANAEVNFRRSKGDIEAALLAEPELLLKAKAIRKSHEIQVDCEIDRIIPGVDHFVVLLQAEVNYKGGNGIVFHKHVVRDLVALDPTSDRQATFDLNASEQKSDHYLSEVEKSWARTQNFKFAQRLHRLDRQNLKIAFFAQDRETKKVLNAVMVDVK